jgi:hypothetical protein
MGDRLKPAQRADDRVSIGHAGPIVQSATNGDTSNHREVADAERKAVGACSENTVATANPRRKCSFIGVAMF